jgi:hypothetical protein
VARVASELRGTVRVLRFGPFGEKIITVTDTGQVARWHSTTGKKLSEWRLKSSLASSLALVDHGGIAATGMTDGSVTLHHLPMGPAEPSSRVPGDVWEAEVSAYCK